MSSLLISDKHTQYIAIQYTACKPKPWGLFFIALFVASNYANYTVTDLFIH